MRQTLEAMIKRRDKKRQEIEEQKARLMKLQAGLAIDRKEIAAAEKKALMEGRGVLAHHALEYVLLNLPPADLEAIAKEAIAVAADRKKPHVAAFLNTPKWQEAVNRTSRPVSAEGEEAHSDDTLRSRSTDSVAFSGHNNPAPGYRTPGTAGWSSRE